MDTIETEQVEGWNLHFGKEAKAAQEALAQRPKFSIRLRIALGFLVIFFLFCVVTLTAMIFVYKLDKKLRFLENTGLGH